MHFVSCQPLHGPHFFLFRKSSNVILSGALVYTKNVCPRNDQWVFVGRTRALDINPSSQQNVRTRRSKQRYLGCYVIKAFMYFCYRSHFCVLLIRQLSLLRYRVFTVRLNEDIDSDCWYYEILNHFFVSSEDKATHSRWIPMLCYGYSKVRLLWHIVVKW